MVALPPIRVRYACYGTPYIGEVEVFRTLTYDGSITASERDHTIVDESSPVAHLMQALDSHNLEQLRRQLSHDFVFEEVAGPGRESIEALEHHLQLFFDAFPDLTFKTARKEHVDQRAYVEFRAIGTHKGAFLNVDPTESLAIVSGVLNLQISGGLVQRLRLVVDYAGLRRQLLVAQGGTRATN